MPIRPALEGDAGAIADLYLAARAEMSYLQRRHTETETRTWIRDVVLAELDVLVAHEGGLVLGFVAFGDELVEHLYVDPGAQGRGIGAALLAAVKERRPSGLRLWVFQQNADACRFYERHGFVCFLRSDGAENEEHEPDALYEWRPG